MKVGDMDNRSPCHVNSCNRTQYANADVKFYQGQ